MDKFKQKLMTKKLRANPNNVEVNELIGYIHSQGYVSEAIEEVHRIINNPMSDITPSNKAKLNGVIIKVMKVKK